MKFLSTDFFEYKVNGVICLLLELEVFELNWIYHAVSTGTYMNACMHSHSPIKYMR